MKTFKMTIFWFAFFVLGNLLNSLMGSGEEEEGEEAQEDSSPIELD